MKTFLKRIADLLAFLSILPALLVYALMAGAVGPDRTFPGWSQAFSLLPGLSGCYLRRAFYRLVLPRCEADSQVWFGTVLSHVGARIGRGVFVGPYCVIGDVDLEDDVLIASHVSVINGARQHGIGRLDVPIRSQPGTWSRVTIGRDSWIGERSVVMADVGRHCVVGAGAVVTRPVPDYAIAVGVPARVVGYRDGAPGGSMPCPDPE